MFLRRFSILIFLLMCMLSRETYARHTFPGIVLNAKAGKEKIIGGHKYQMVGATIRNNSNDTLQYLIMSCSVEDLFTIDNKNCRFQPGVCTRNVPIYRKLAPGKSLSYVFLVNIESKAWKNNTASMRLGMYVIIPKGVAGNEFQQIEKGKIPANLIWSNLVFLRKS